MLYIHVDTCMSGTFSLANVFKIVAMVWSKQQQKYTLKNVIHKIVILSPNMYDKPRGV